MTLENIVPWIKNRSLTNNGNLNSLQEEMNRVFNNFWSSPNWALKNMAQTGESSLGLYSPNMEMTETDGFIEFSAELPGVNEKDIDVSLSPDGNTLSIRGEKKLTKEKREKNFYFAERSYGSFLRSFGLPCAVDQNNVQAHFKNGVLDIKLKKVNDESSGVKHINIKSS